MIEESLITTTLTFPQILKYPDASGQDDAL